MVSHSFLLDSQHSVVYQPSVLMKIENPTPLATFSRSLFPDISFKHKSGTISHAHRVILSSYSPVFKSMFLQSFQEKEQNTIEISDDEEKYFEMMIDLLYASQVECTNKDLPPLYLITVTVHTLFIYLDNRVCLYYQ